MRGTSDSHEFLGFRETLKSAVKRRERLAMYGQQGERFSARYANIMPIKKKIIFDFI